MRKPPFPGAIRLHSHFPDEHRHDAEHIAAHPDFEAGDRGHGYHTVSAIWRSSRALLSALRAASTIAAEICIHASRRHKTVSNSRRAGGGCRDAPVRTVHQVRLASKEWYRPPQCSPRIGHNLRSAASSSYRAGRGRYLELQPDKYSTASAILSGGSCVYLPISKCRAKWLHTSP